MRTEAMIESERAEALSKITGNHTRQYTQSLVKTISGDPNPLALIDKLNDIQRASTEEVYVDLLMKLGTMEETTKDQLLAHMITNDVLMFFRKGLSEVVQEFIDDPSGPGVTERLLRKFGIKESNCSSCDKAGTPRCDHFEEKLSEEEGDEH